MALSRFCSHSGEGPFLTPRTRRSAKGRAQRMRLAEVERHRDWAGEFALDRLRCAVLERADIGRGEVARNAVDAGAVRPVRRDGDVEHRIVEAFVFRERLAERRVVRQFDDAVVVVGDFKLRLRHQHAAAFDAADGADLKRDLLAGDVGAGRHEHAGHAAASIRRAAHDLDRIAVAGVDHADAQAVGVRVLLRLDHLGDDVGARAACPCPRRIRPRGRPSSAFRRSVPAWRRLSRCSFSQARVNFMT